MKETDINTTPPELKPQVLKPLTLKPPKLGGWLLIIYVLLFLALLKLIQTFIEYAKFLNSSPPPEVREMVVFNLILSVIYFVFIFYLLVLMNLKKRIFLKRMTAFLIFTILINIVSYFLFKPLSADINAFLLQRMITVFIASVSLMAYFFNSKRVKATFIL